ncbi:MAG: hypothetical protein JWO68_495 [Actinomycetia bacterium]|jgi:hypothetical protein|nr:hypothetical protein [Actinomycetes bacterium]
MTEETQLVEAQLADARRRVDELRDELASSDLASPEDNAVLIRELEDQQALAANLEARLEQLRGAG